MLRYMLKSKLHQARVTSADLYYEGSLTIDKDLMEAADIIEFEKVHVVNINNGERFETYVIPGDRGSKVIGLNGAAARKGAAGDQVIIITYTALEDKELDKYKPIIILLDEKNEIKDIDNKVKEETIGMTNGN